MNKIGIYVTLFLFLLDRIFSACTMNAPPANSEAPIDILAFDPQLKPINTPTPVDGKSTETIFSFYSSFYFDEKPEREKLRDIVRAYFDNKKSKRFVCP
jgi:hypothetical protein